MPEEYAASMTSRRVWSTAPPRGLRLRREQQELAGDAGVFAAPRPRLFVELLDAQARAGERRHDLAEPPEALVLHLDRRRAGQLEVIPAGVGEHGFVKEVLDPAVAVEAHRDGMLLREQEAAAGPEGADDPRRPRLEVVDPHEHAALGHDHVELAEVRERVDVGGDELRLGHRFARDRDRLVGEVDTRHVRAAAGKLLRRLAGRALQMEDPRAREWLEAGERLLGEPAPRERLAPPRVYLVPGTPVRLDEVAHRATRREKPPSTTIVWPRIMSASGEQRNATAPAMSSGATSFPTGFAAPASSISSRFGKCSSAPVSTTPPETALTRIPGASSTAR